MSVTISLFDLVNVSISHPEPGMVNFPALRSLLHAILRTLGIQDVRTEERPELLQRLDSQVGPDSRSGEVAGRSHTALAQLEQKVKEVEVQLQQLSRLPTGTELLNRSKVDSGCVHDMWNLLQLRKNTETNREGVDKAMSLMEEMVQEINNLKNFQSTVEDRISDIDKNINMVSTDINLINDLLNDTERSQQFVSWKTLQKTLLDSTDDDFSPWIESSANIVQAPGSEAKVSGVPQEEASETLPKEKEPVPAAVTFSEEAHPILKYKPFGKSEVEMPDLTSFLVTDAEAQLHPEVILVLQHIRHMANSQPALVQRVSALEKALSDLESGRADQHGVQAAEDADDLKSGDIKEQLSSLRNMVKKIDEELKEMRSFQDTCGKGGGRIQQQLNKLGPVLEKIMSSSCALLGMSLGLDTEATCPVCSLDVSQDASNLCQRFQKLQDTVNTMVDSMGDIAKDLELQSQLQDNIFQLQGECERLNQTTSQLLQGDQLHQKNIETLTDSISRLERKCIEEVDFGEFQVDFGEFQVDFGEFQVDFGEFQVDFGEFQVDFGEFQVDFGEFQVDFGEFQVDFRWISGGFQVDFGEFQVDFGEFQVNFRWISGGFW
ncbi:uncharacterized protein LOC119953525 [Scyliorhinus canicula]|uniref:uncharacterized protein LOC119953525 n=1 Tax=Scyliorhinus canicula TaxID=7830 RepID=UPI0018F30D26|nr:uncharacterized protein LOC119953525 [Scyliorhinus canicula]